MLEENRMVLPIADIAHETAAEVAQAWEEEIARRVAAMERGDTQWISSEELFERLEAIVARAGRA